MSKDDTQTYAILQNAPDYLREYQPAKEDQVYLGRKLRKTLTRDIHKIGHSAMIELIQRIQTGWEDEPTCAYYQICAAVLKTLKTLESEPHYTKSKLVEECLPLLASEGWAEATLALRTAKEDHRLKEHANEKIRNKMESLMKNDIHTGFNTQKWDFSVTFEFNQISRFAEPEKI